MAHLPAECNALNGRAAILACPADLSLDQHFRKIGALLSRQVSQLLQEIIIDGLLRLAPKKKLLRELVLAGHNCASFVPMEKEA